MGGPQLWQGLGSVEITFLKCHVYPTHSCCCLGLVGKRQQSLLLPSISSHEVSPEQATWVGNRWPTAHLWLGNTSGPVRIPERPKQDREEAQGCQAQLAYLTTNPLEPVSPAG